MSRATIATLQSMPYQTQDAWRASALINGAHASVVITEQHKDLVRGARLEVRADAQGRWVTV